MEEGHLNTTIARVPTEHATQQLILLGMVNRVRRITTKKGDQMAFLTLEGPGGNLEAIVFPRTYERFKQLLVPDRVLVVSGKLDRRSEREEPAVIVDWFKEPHELLPLGGNGAPIDSEPPWETSGNFVRETPTPYTASEPQPAPQAEHDPELAPSSPPMEKMNDGAPAFEEPPAPPATLYVTLERTQDPERDFERLAQLHRLLNARPGRDHFIFLLKRGRRRIELRFPNQSTSCTPDLERQIAEVVGRENLRVVMETAPAR